MHVDDLICYLKLCTLLLIDDASFGASIVSREDDDDVADIDDDSDNDDDDNVVPVCSIEYGTVPKAFVENRIGIERISPGMSKSRNDILRGHLHALVTISRKDG